MISDLEPRWENPGWTPEHGWTVIAADVVTGLAFIAIPVLLSYFLLRQREALQLPKLTIFFCVFIFLSGLIHLSNVLVFWFTFGFWINTLLRVATAVAAVATVIATIRDIPLMNSIQHEVERRKETEAKLYKIISDRDRIVTKLGEHTRMLRDSEKEVEHLLYVTSHDLREPVRAIKTFPTLIFQSMGDKLDSRAHDYLTRMQLAAHRLDNLLEAIQQISAVRRKTTTPRLVPGDVIFKEAMPCLEEAAKSKNITIQVVTDLPDVWCDLFWAGRVMANLLSNAIKFSPANSVIEVGGYSEDGMTGFFVADRGPGVDPTDSRIWRLFGRGVGREVEGTGAGLAIVQQVIRRHKGRAWCEERQGGGSTFYAAFRERGETGNGTGSSSCGVETSGSPSG